MLSQHTEQQYSIEQFPVEILLFIISKLDVKDVSLLTQVNLYFHMLVEADRYHELSPKAIQRIKNIDALESVQAIYCRSVELEQLTYLKLRHYYLRAHEIQLTLNQEHDESPDDIPEDNQEEQIQPCTQLYYNYLTEYPDIKERLEVAIGKSNMRKICLEQSDSTITAITSSYKTDWPTIIHKACSNTDHHCRIFAAAANGNTAKLHYLIHQSPPLLNDIFNTTSWDFFQQEIIIQQHVALGFPSGINLFFYKLRGEPCLVSFSRFYEQQSILDCYYQIALKNAPLEDRLYWAVICHQPKELLIDLIKSGQDVNHGMAFDHSQGKGLFTPLHAAVIWQEIETLQLLFQHGAKITGQFPDLLEIAMMKQDQDIILTLLDNGAELPGMSIELLMAMMNLDIEVITQLTESNSHLRECIQNYILEFAAFRRDVNTLNTILNTFPTWPRPLSNRSLFYHAAMSGQVELINLMIERELNVLPHINPAFSMEDQPLLKILIEHAINTNDLTYLYKALDFGLDIHKQDKNDIRTWIEVVAYHGNKEARAKINVILECEMKIQQALMSVQKKSYWPSWSLFGNTLDNNLRAAAKLEPLYFLHRVDCLLNNESNLWMESTLAKLRSWKYMQYEKQLHEEALYNQQASIN